MPSSPRQPQLRVGAVLAIAVAVGLAAWLATRDEGGGRTTPPGSSTVAGPTGKRVVQVTLRGLEALATTLGRPIYWAGQRPGGTYELTELPDGSVFLRYLPPGTKLGAASSLTVGTYPVADAFTAAERSAAQPGIIRLAAQGGVAFYGKSAPTSVYVAFPGVDYQIEVYDPSPAQARGLVTSGKIVPIR